MIQTHIVAPRIYTVYTRIVDLHQNAPSQTELPVKMVLRMRSNIGKPFLSIVYHKLKLKTRILGFTGTVK